MEICESFALIPILCIILSANDSHIQAMTRTHRSKYREEILQCLQEHEEKRVGAQEIYAWLKEKGSDINLATVYRNLERLYEENQIRRVRMIGEEEMMYQVNKPDQSCSNHLHLYCRRCGRVIHMKEREMQEIESVLYRSYGFALDCSDSLISGLCRTCQEEEKKNGNVH